MATTATATPSVARRKSGQWIDIRRRFVRNKLAVVGLAMVAIVVVVGIFAPLLAPADPADQDLTNTQANPSAAHWFGTDQIGRDQLSRVIYGTRYALVIGLTAVLASVIVGVLVGAVAGYFGRFWDALMMRITDSFLAFPYLVGAIMIITALGRGLTQIIVAIALFAWPTTARLLRSSILSVRESEYVEAARAVGASRWRIVSRHILPNSLTPVLIYAAVSVPGAIIAQAALSFLGVGLKPGTPDWGQLIADGQKFFNYKDFLWLCPSLALLFTTLGFVFVADGLRDALDPKLRGS